MQRSLLFFAILLTSAQLLAEDTPSNMGPVNPSHLSAREYLGEAHLQAGQPDKAREQLMELERLCGRSCDEYRDLTDAIEGTRRAPKHW